MLEAECLNVRLWLEAAVLALVELGPLSTPKRTSRRRTSAFPRKAAVAQVRSGGPLMTRFRHSCRWPAAKERQTIYCDLGYRMELDCGSFVDKELWNE